MNFFWKSLAHRESANSHEQTIMGWDLSWPGGGRRGGKLVVRWSPWVRDVMSPLTDTDN